MRRNAFLLALLLAAFALPQVSWGQDLDDLDDLDEDVVTEQPYRAGIKSGAWEMVFMVGNMNLSKTLLQAQQIIVDWNGGETVYADMRLVGETSFSPQFRIARNYQNLSLELSLGFSLGDYSQEVTNLNRRPADGEEPFTENDAEKGSLFMWQYELDLTYHIRKFGRVLPFFSIGIGNQQYHLDSRYVASASNVTTYMWGAGMRIVGDELFSFRVEFRNYIHNMPWQDGGINWHSNAVFLEDQIDPNQDDNLLDIPMTNLDNNGDVVPFGGFNKVQLNSFWIGLGMVASF